MMWNMLKMGLRVTTLLMTLLLTALVGNMIATNHDAADTAAAAINYCMFVAILGWVVSILGVASFFASILARPAIQLPLDAAALLFSCIGGIVLAAKLRVVDCSDFHSKKMPSDWIAFGSMDDAKKCREIQASCVFIWFMASLIGGSLFLAIRDTRESGGSIVGSFKSFPSSKPSMSQLSSSV